MPPKQTLCEECQLYLGKKTKPINKIICENCKVLDKYTVMTKTNAKKLYLLKDDDLDDLHSYEGRTTYGPATYFTIEDIKNKASIKFGIHKDGLNEYLENVLNEKKIKSAERKEKIAKTKEIKRNDRRDKLIQALRKVKLPLRDDSALCKQYIEGTTEYNLETIVKRMCQMKYLFEYCHMNECKDIAYERHNEELRAGYFPDCSVFDYAEYIALQKYSGGKYPDVFPWLN